MDHTFSYMKEIEATRLVRRPWWAFWRHDELVTEKIQRRHFSEVTKEQADWVIANSGMLHELFGLHHMQVESGPQAPVYIPTAGVYIEAARTNLVRQSMDFAGR